MMLSMALETAATRIRRLVAQAIRAGRFANEAQFLKAAELSDGYFGELEKRCAENPEATVRGDTAKRMAAALGVSLAELLGAADEAEQPLVDVYPNRAWAIQAARNLALPEAAIQVVLKQDPGRDLHRMAWFRRIEAEAENIRPPS